MSYQTGQRILGYSVMTLAVGILLLLFTAPLIFSSFTYILNTVNQTYNQSISSAQSNLTNQMFSYKDPFTTSTIPYLYSIVKFFYLADTTPQSFYTILALDILLMAFDVYWMRTSQEG